MKSEWIKPLQMCTELQFILDEETKRIVWSSDESKIGEYCYTAFFGTEKECPLCPHLEVEKPYSWEFYDRRYERWLKIKNYLFRDGESLLRAGNFNRIDDEMSLSHDSIEEISLLQKLLIENRRIKDQLEQEAIYDQMTGLFNRNRFNLDIASGEFDKAGTGVLYFDLNNLKVVNDKYRHEAGDRLICTLASAIAATADSLKKASCYRIGGDEFVMLVSDCTREELDEAKTVFEAKLELINNEEPKCETAIGMSYSSEQCEAESLVSLADKEMYIDKQRKKGKK